MTSVDGMGVILMFTGPSRGSFASASYGNGRGKIQTYF